MSQEHLRLYTFAISHFSEKIRWTLDAARIPYRETTWTPSFHMARARLKTRRGTTVPIIEIGSEVVQDSTDIIHWLDRRYPPFSLLPADPDARREVLEIEDRFDEVGKRVIRFAYSVAMDSPKAVQEMWLTKSNAVERLIMPIVFPLIAPAFRKMFHINEVGAARAFELIDRELAWLDTRLADGRRYLVGDTLTVADITAAALLAPIASPAEHSVYSQSSYREVMRPAVKKLGDNRRGLDWVRELYRRDRAVTAARS